MSESTQKLLDKINQPKVEKPQPAPGKKALVVGAAALAALTVGHRVSELSQSDNPFGLSRTTDPGSGVTETVPIGEWESDLPADPKDASVTVTARQGDTIWGITREVLGPDTEIRDEVEKIVYERGTTEVQPGEQINVPVPEDYQPPAPAGE